MVRIVYQNFLLPEIPKFFMNLKSFLISSYPHQQWIEIQAELNTLTIQDRYKKEMQFKRNNQKLMLNAKSYVVKYIDPLRQCPTFEQIIVERVFKENQSKRMDEVSIAITAQNFNGKDIHKCAKKYNKKLNEFLRKNKIDKACRVLPMFYYKSASQLCEKEQKVWKNLTKNEQFFYEDRFMRKLNYYLLRINKIAAEEGMTMEEIIIAKKQQHLPTQDTFYQLMFS